MSLETSIQTLTEIGGDIKGLFDVFTGLAAEGKETTAAQRKSFERLIGRLDTTARQASRERRDTEIAQLETVIDAHEKTLAVPGLPKSVRDALKADLIRKRSRRTRLQNLAATDFDGILTAEDVRELEELVAAAREEVAKKKFAAELLSSVMKAADLALSLAGKLAL